MAAACETSKISTSLHSCTLSKPLSCPALKRVFMETQNNNNSNAAMKNDDDLRLSIRQEAQSDIKQEPILFNYYFSSILSHVSLESALPRHLAMKLTNSTLPVDTLSSHLFIAILGDEHGIRTAIRDELRAVKERDPTYMSYLHCFQHFKAFLACQAHRIAYKLWAQGRSSDMALLIQSKVFEVFDFPPWTSIREQESDREY